MKKIGDVTTTADQNGEFINGNVAAGIAPTILEADWFNSVQREILNVLLKAKIEQNPDIDDQLTQAIEALAGNAFGGKIKQTTGDSTTDVMSQKAVTDELKKAATIDAIYPAGIAIFFAQNKNPNQLFPGTKWQYTGENKTIRLAKADGSDILKTGGADTIKLTEAQLPAHGHTFSATTSSFDYGTKKTNKTGAHFHNIIGSASPLGNQESNACPGGYRNKTQPTESAGEHEHAVVIGKHEHTVAGTTDNTGDGSEINITNAFVTLMCWYRVS